MSYGTEQTECFTMSETLMDNKALSPGSAQPDSSESHSANDDSARAARSFSTVSNQIENSSRRTIFGSRGVYAGSHWLLYLAIGFVVLELERWLIGSLRPGLGPLRWRLIIEVALAVAAILPGFFMARIEGCSIGDFGLPLKRAFGRNFWVGSLWGFASLSVLMIALRLAGAFQFGSLALHGTRIWKYAFFYALFFLFTGLFEDFLMRGYSQWIMAQAMTFWPAAVLLSIAFGAIHGSNPGETKTGVVAAGFIGLFFCLTLRRTGDLWWAIGFHMAWDWGESYFFSVADSGSVLPGHLLNSSVHGPVWLSGGSVGPEGSYFVFIVVGALWFLFDRIYPEPKYGLRESNGDISPLPPVL